MRVIYVLPFYDENTDTHLFYNYELIREARGQGMDILMLDAKALGFWKLWLELRRLGSAGYKICYVHYSFYGALAAIFSGYKVFYFNRGMPWLFRRGFFEEAVFRFILRRTTLVTGPESLAKEYVKHYGVKEYKILSNWIDVERFRPREDKIFTKRWFALGPDSKVVLFVHHLSSRKGADLLSKIAEGFQGVQFFVLGEGPEYENLEKNKKLKMFGKVANKDVPIYFQAADVFLMPSREEGSPHVILEALAAGTPFVASKVGGVKEVVPPGFEKFLCPVGDVPCFQEKIRKLLSDKNLYEEFSARGLEFASKFDKSRGVKEFIQLFQ